jgi:hypothetical protein
MQGLDASLLLFRFRFAFRRREDQIGSLGHGDDLFGEGAQLLGLGYRCPNPLVTEEGAGQVPQQGEAMGRCAIQMAASFAMTHGVNS